MVEIPTWAGNPLQLRQSQPIFQAIRKWWSRWPRLIPYTECPTATRLGLCNRLPGWRQFTWMPAHHWPRLLRQHWCHLIFSHPGVNTLSPRQNGRHFPDDIFNCIFLNENVWISNGISLKFVPKGQINNIPALVQIMAWRRPGDKPLSETMMVSLLTHICVTRPKWVNRALCQLVLITVNSRYIAMPVTMNSRYITLKLSRIGYISVLIAANSISRGANYVGIDISRFW